MGGLAAPYGLSQERPVCQLEMRPTHTHKVCVQCCAQLRCESYKRTLARDTARKLERNSEEMSTHCVQICAQGAFVESQRHLRTKLYRV